MRQTFQTPGSVVLELRLPDGSIEVETGDTTETVVNLDGIEDEELGRIARVEMRETGGRFVVTVEVDDRGDFGFRFWRRRDLRLHVRAPDGVEVQIKTGSADARGRGRFSTVAVQSGSGDVDFDKVEGDAVVKTGSGDIRVREAGGEAVISSGSGDVELGRVGRAAQVRSASGDVHIGEAGAEVTVQTASGDQQIDAVGEGQVTLQSASGDMTVGVRRGSRLAVDARSMSGDTTSEIDLEADEAEDLGDEGPLVELRATAMSGDIRVVRA